MPQSSGFSLHTASPPSIDDTEAAHREGSHLEEGLTAAAVGPTPPVDAGHGGGYYSSFIDYDLDRLLGPVRASTGVGSRGTGLVRANRGVQAPRGDSPQQLRRESCHPVGERDTPLGQSGTDRDVPPAVLSLIHI